MATQPPVSISRRILARKAAAQGELDYANLSAEVTDIAASGYGGDMEAWHKRELQRLFSPLSPAQKQAAFKYLVDDGTLTGDGWSLADVRMVARLLGVKISPDLATKIFENSEDEF